MSRDFDFWKYQKGIYLDTQSIYEQLCDGEYVEGLEELPIDEIIEKISQQFKDWSRLDKINWESEDKGSFQIFTTSQFVRVDVYGNMLGEDINKFIDIMLEYQCPLYDPQINERFDERF